MNQLTYNLDIEGCARLIKDQRIRIGFNQEDFGKLIGYQKSKVSKLESGKNNITVKNFYAILNKLKIKTKVDMTLN